MYQYSYGWEKLHIAVHTLAGATDQKQRLVNAVVFNLIHITPENDLPPQIQNKFKEFMQHITSIPAIGDGGTVQATIETFDEMEIGRAIEKIISFYDTVCRYMERD